MKIKSEKVVKIADGSHKGLLVEIQQRDKSPEGYEYLDIMIEEKDTKMILKAGVTPRISENTKLGMILQNFGVKIKPEMDYDLDILLNSKVEFITITEKKEQGSFARIIPESIKPLPR